MTKIFLLIYFTYIFSGNVNCDCKKDQSSCKIFCAMVQNSVPPIIRNTGIPPINTQTKYSNPLVEEYKSHFTHLTTTMCVIEDKSNNANVPKKQEIQNAIINGINNSSPIKLQPDAGKISPSNQIPNANIMSSVMANKIIEKQINKDINNTVKEKIDFNQICRIINLLNSVEKKVKMDKSKLESIKKAKLEIFRLNNITKLNCNTSEKDQGLMQDKNDSDDVYLYKYSFIKTFTPYITKYTTEKPLINNAIRLKRAYKPKTKIHDISCASSAAKIIENSGSVQETFYRLITTTITSQITPSNTVFIVDKPKTIFKTITETSIETVYKEAKTQKKSDDKQISSTQCTCQKSFPAESTCSMKPFENSNKKDVKLSVTTVIMEVQTKAQSSIDLKETKAKSDDVVKKEICTCGKVKADDTTTKNTNNVSNQNQNTISCTLQTQSENKNPASLTTDHYSENTNKNSDKHTDKKSDSTCSKNEKSKFAKKCLRKLKVLEKILGDDSSSSSTKLNKSETNEEKNSSAKKSETKESQISKKSDSNILHSLYTELFARDDKNVNSESSASSNATFARTTKKGAKEQSKQMQSETKNTKSVGLNDVEALNKEIVDIKSLIKADNKERQAIKENYKERERELFSFERCIINMLKRNTKECDKIPKILSKLSVLTKDENEEDDLENEDITVTDKKNSKDDTKSIIDKEDEHINSKVMAEISENLDSKNDNEKLTSDLQAEYKQLSKIQLTESNLGGKRSYANKISKKQQKKELKSKKRNKEKSTLNGDESPEYKSKPEKHASKEDFYALNDDNINNSESEESTKSNQDNEQYDHTKTISKTITVTTSIDNSLIEWIESESLSNILSKTVLTTVTLTYNEQESTNNKPQSKEDVKAKSKMTNNIKKKETNKQNDSYIDGIVDRTKEMYSKIVKGNEEPIKISTEVYTEILSSEKISLANETSSNNFKTKNVSSSKESKKTNGGFNSVKRSILDKSFDKTQKISQKVKTKDKDIVCTDSKNNEKDNVKTSNSDTKLSKSISSDQLSTTTTTNDNKQSSTQSHKDNCKIVSKEYDNSKSIVIKNSTCSEKSTNDHSSSESEQSTLSSNKENSESVKEKINDSSIINITIMKVDNTEKNKDRSSVYKNANHENNNDKTSVSIEKHDEKVSTTNFETETVTKKDQNELLTICSSKKTNTIETKKNVSQSLSTDDANTTEDIKTISSQSSEKEKTADRTKKKKTITKTHYIHATEISST